jgi:ABC-type polysaccharide/polyol phosphate export permease
MESGAVTTTADTLAGDLVEQLEAEGAFEQAAGGAAVEYVDYRPSLYRALLDVWASRRVAWAIASSLVRAALLRYRAGPTWLILQAFMGTIGYSLIFGGGIFNVKAPNGMPYFLFTMVGMMGWQIFQVTLTISTRSFLRMKSLLRDINIPLVLIPIAGSAQALIRFLLQLIAYIGFVIYFWAAQGHLYAQLSPKYLFQSIGGLFLCLAFAWGLSLWTAPLTAHTRDVRMIVKFAIPFWMFVTPVLYPIEQLKGTTRFVAELNPLSTPVEMVKVGTLGAGSIRISAAIWSVSVICGVFLSGVWFLSHYGARVVGLRDDDDDEELLV